jgi:hypothetical protein
MSAADRMRELLARTVHDHIMEERSTAAALQDIRQRLDALDGATAIAATLDGLAASLGALDSLLPLDGARRLAGDVEDHPVDLADLVGDPGRDPASTS